MKTKVLFITFATFTAACSNHESIELEYTISDSQKNCVDYRSYEEALEIAEKSINMLNYTSGTTRSQSKKRIIDQSERIAYVNNNKTRSVSNTNDTLIYVFNFENNDGFALVSASKNTEALLAITDKGYCSPDEESEIQGFNTFIEAAKDYVYNASKAPILRKPSDPIVDTKDSVIYAYQEVGPYISVNWGQSLPEGEFCPNGLAGCANTALAQIISYYNYPTMINITYPNADVSAQNLNWSALKTHATGHPRTSCDDQSTHDAIGRLLRQLGKYTNSSYDSNSTGTSLDNLEPALDSLGYSHGTLRLYKSIVARIALDGHHLIFMGGFANQGGHGWALDGYNTVSATIYHMGRTITSGWFIMNTTHETKYYLHFNWGWYGDCNGYFLEGIYDTTQAYSYDNPTNVHNYNLNQNVQMVEIYH